MIQRIQSVFLFLAAGLLGGQFALPYGTITNQTAEVPASLADGVLTPTDNIGLMGLTILGAVLSLVAIFLFKNRKLQAQITGLSVVISILLLALIGVVFSQLLPVFNANAGHLGLGLGLPLVGVVFQFLAQRAIKKDENLVRSMDRLR
jgi:ABC-type uncharacterized transport system permease subunit